MSSRSSNKLSSKQASSNDHASKSKDPDNLRAGSTQASKDPGNLRARITQAPRITKSNVRHGPLQPQNRRVDAAPFLLRHTETGFMSDLCRNCVRAAAIVSESELCKKSANCAHVRNGAPALNPRTRGRESRKIDLSQRRFRAVFQNHAEYHGPICPRHPLYEGSLNQPAVPLHFGRPAHTPV